ncbi:MAG: thiamine pyrophosphate-binding protein [Chloroflexi bacterium]|nr:thiamine pyrophosphate-binding protein [Chloroflexota bacterium]
MQSKAEWGSDVVVELMQAYGIDYAFTNLGGTFRGLLDSIVNFAGNRNPQVIECLHEEIAVSIAHGYTRVSGKPSVALVHNVVGTLHASMAIYDAYVGNAPVIIMSGTGPMSVPQRRPWIDWVHTALVQGNLVRDYVKWDDQPHDTASFLESFPRAHRVAVTEPKGPVYIALDAGWQEEQLHQPLELPDVTKFAAPTRIQADPAALRRTAELLASAELPVILAGGVGRNRDAVPRLVELAETGGIAVVDGGGQLSFPNTHVLDATGTSLLNQADVIVMMDMDEPEQALTERGRYPRGGGASRVKPGATLISVGLTDLWIRATTTDFGKLYPIDLNIAADTSVAIPELTAQLRAMLGENPDRAEILQRRNARVAEARTAARKRWNEELRRDTAKRTISQAQLAQATWNVIKGEKWVVAGNAGGWVRRLWDMDRPGCTNGGIGGAAAVGTNLPKAIGSGLAAKEEGGFCVGFNGDGDFLYVPTSIWTAVHHRIPVLMIVLNNGGYIGEGGHQRYMAEVRERSTENLHVAIEFQHPSVEYTSVARGLGAYTEGPIEHPDELEPAIRRAFHAMKEQSTMALLDVRVGD